MRKKFGEKNHDEMKMIQQIIGRLTTLTGTRAHEMQLLKTL
jgi:hypothetical protein